MSKQYRPKEFIAALKDRGYARTINTARKYMRKHPQGYYTESDFMKAYDWLEVEERWLFQQPTYPAYSDDAPEDYE